MNSFSCLGRSLLAFIVAALYGITGSAQGADYANVAGTEVDFYLDTAFFNASDATVTGNTLTLNFDPQRFTASVSGDQSDSNNVYTTSFSFPMSVYVVAHDGYLVNPAINTLSQTDYAMTGYGEFILAPIAEAFIGSRTGGVFSSGSDPVSYMQGGLLGDTGTANSGTAYGGTHFFIVDGSVRPIFALQFYMGVQLTEAGISTTSIALRQIQYQVQVEQIAAVPEPGRPLLLLAGLATLAGVARRRRGTQGLRRGWQGA